MHSCRDDGVSHHHVVSLFLFWDFCLSSRSLGRESINPALFPVVVYYISFLFALLLVFFLVVGIPPYFWCCGWPLHLPPGFPGSVVLPWPVSLLYTFQGIPLAWLPGPVWCFPPWGLLASALLCCSVGCFGLFLGGLSSSSPRLPFGSRVYLDFFLCLSIRFSIYFFFFVFDGRVII